MKSFVILLKRFFSFQKQDEFFYLKEEFKHQTDTENHKVTFLTSFKKVG